MANVLPVELEEAKGYLCLPLDGLSILEEVKKVVKNFKEYVGVFKVGMELHTRFGYQVVDLIHKLGGKVFLDLKFHDIPNTVKGAARAATEHKVWMFNVHASGGIEMMQAANIGTEDAILLDGNLKKPKIIAVTVLTSLDDSDCNHIYNETVADKVDDFAFDVKMSGLDGIVCSAQDLENEKLKKNPFFFVTPGVKLSDGKVGADQKRVVTPYDAVKNGSSLLVAGRTITGYDTVEEQQSAAIRVLEDIQKALNEKK